ncbi:LysR family transcriptional regulator [Pararoseomonas sp. SCSIO 73927]|uniref:LysR family transcriptional regulator n=1 Tax=Pararoseomonas sp. SCSIO 73927 TaxID=3114537 RepID=UPI0030D3911F
MFESLVRPDRRTPVGAEQLRSTPAGPARINLAAHDLNLLVALEALLNCRSVTQAGRRVGLSQPAMSRALSRLRGVLGDDLLVRSSTGLVLTRRAERLAEQLPPILDQIRDVLGSELLPPEVRHAKVTIALPDHQVPVLLPPLLRRLAEHAPHIEVAAEPTLASALKRLERGEIDFAIGQIEDAPAGIFARKLPADRLVGLVREDHPALAGPLTSERLNELRHVLISGETEEGFGHVHDGMQRLSLPDQQPLRLPNLLTALVTLAETDLILIVPRRVAVQAAGMARLAVLDLPVPLPMHEPFLIWHERRHRDPEHGWLRAQIAAAMPEG